MQITTFLLLPGSRWQFINFLIATAPSVTAIYFHATSSDAVMGKDILIAPTPGNELAECN